MGEFNGRALRTVERLAQNFIDATRYGIADETGAWREMTGTVVMYARYLGCTK